MELIPEDLKADLKKAPSVEVILGHTFRVWHNGRTAKDYWVRDFKKHKYKNKKGI